MSEPMGGNGFPAAPPPPSIDQTRPARPAMVDRALKLWWTALACWVVAKILARTLHLSSAIGLVRDPTGPGMHLGHLSQGLVLSPIVSAIGSLVLLVIWAWLILRLGHGANWARVLLTICAVFGEVGLVGAIIPDLGSLTVGSAIHGLLSIVLFVSVIAAVVTMYRADARPYFRRH